MLADDPEAPTTIDEALRVPAADGRPGRGLGDDRRRTRSRAPTRGDRLGATEEGRGRRPGAQAGVELAARLAGALGDRQLARRDGSAARLLLPRDRPADRPHGPGIKAQGVAVPGLAMYILIGRTPELRLEPDLGRPRRPRRLRRGALRARTARAPTRDSTHYLFEGECRPFERFNAGLLNGEPLTYDVSVHGPVFATATVDGEPYALSRRRSTFGRDGAEPRRPQGHDRGRGDDAEAASGRPPNKFGFTFNWAYVSRKKTAFFTLRPPARARPRARPPPADARDRQVRVDAATSAATSIRTTSAARTACCSTGTTVGARVHARRRRAVRLGAAGRAVRPVAARRPGSPTTSAS